MVSWNCRSASLALFRCTPHLGHIEPALWGMRWPWHSPETTTRRADERKARFVRIAREAHERSRQDLGDQKLKPRDWDQSGPMDRAGADFERKQSQADARSQRNESSLNTR
jgi:hypothetical protein